MDAMAQFPNAGFDSPEVQAQIAATFEQIRKALDQLAHACREAVQQIADVLAPLIRQIARVYYRLCHLHLIPRQYRSTIMRKKIRRYAYDYTRSTLPTSHI